MRTRRRLILDELLGFYSSLYKAPVLDVGGKKVNHRGLFRLSKFVEDNEVYVVNLDSSVNPDFCGDILDLPSLYSFNTIICTETLEHLADPQACLLKIFNSSKNSATLILSMPWLVPTHADPFDYNRWTLYKLKQEINASGFDLVAIHQMGSFVDVIVDLCHYKLLGITSNRYILRFWQIFLLILSNLFPPRSIQLDLYNSNPSISTGWFIIARRRLL